MDVFVYIRSVIATTSVPALPSLRRKLVFAVLIKGLKRKRFREASAARYPNQKGLSYSQVAKEHQIEKPTPGGH
jgi:hypothetical protein